MTEKELISGAEYFEMSVEELKDRIAYLGITLEEYKIREQKRADELGITIKELRERQRKNRNNRFCSNIGEFEIRDSITGEIIVPVKNFEKYWRNK